MESKIIAITSGKGGVGKSTVASNIAHFIGWQGKKTVLLDFDIGLRTMDIILGFNSEDIKHDIVEVMEGNIDFNDCILPIPNVKNLFFLAANDNYDKEILDIEKTKKFLDKLKSEFQYIIIDSPSGVEKGFINSVYYSDVAIIVINPEISSVRDSDKVIEILDHKTDKKRNIDKFLLVNKYSEEQANNGEMFSVEEIIKSLGLPLLGVIEFDHKVIISTNEGKPICLYKNNKGGENFRNITKRLLGKNIPFNEIEKRYGLWDKIKNVFSKWF